MRAIVCREFGPPEKLVVEERPLPQCARRRSRRPGQGRRCQFHRRARDPGPLAAQAQATVYARRRSGGRHLRGGRRRQRTAHGHARARDRLLRRLRRSRSRSASTKCCRSRTRCRSRPQRRSTSHRTPRCMHCRIARACSPANRCSCSEPAAALVSRRSRSARHWAPASSARHRRPRNWTWLASHGADATLHYPAGPARSRCTEGVCRPAARAERRRRVRRRLRRRRRNLRGACVALARETRSLPGDRFRCRCPGRTAERSAVSQRRHHGHRAQRSGTARASSQSLRVLPRCCGGSRRRCSDPRSRRHFHSSTRRQRSDCCSTGVRPGASC